MVPTQTVKNHTGTPPNEPHVIQVTAIDEELTDDYTVTLEYDFHFWVDRKILTVSNTCSNYDLKYTVYGAISEAPGDDDWYTLVGPGGQLEEQTVGCGTNQYQMTDLEWRWIRVMCKNAEAGLVSHGKVEVRCVRRP